MSMLVRELDRPKQIILFRNCRASDSHIPNLGRNLSKQFSARHDTAARQGFNVCRARETKYCDLLDFLRKRKTIEETGDVLSARLKLLGVPFLSLGPAVCIHGRFDVHQMVSVRAKGHHV